MTKPNLFIDSKLFQRRQQVVARVVAAVQVVQVRVNHRPLHLPLGIDRQRKRIMKSTKNKEITAITSITRNIRKINTTKITKNMRKIRKRENIRNLKATRNMKTIKITSRKSIRKLKNQKNIESIKNVESQ